MNEEYKVGTKNVSRETYELLNDYVRMINKWNSTINLISKKTIADLWSRHILDSAQLSVFLDSHIRKWVDFGSGAGFPGIVISILAKEQFSSLEMNLIESDQRKCVFLREVSRELKLNAKIISSRIENCSKLNADIISARALAPMKKLLLYFDSHSKIGSKGLFLKGKNIQSELNVLRHVNRFEINIEPSLINSDGVIVEVIKKRNFETDKTS